MENKLNLPLKKKKNEAESPRLDPLMRALKGANLKVVAGPSGAGWIDR